MLTIEQINVFKKCSEWLGIKRMNIRYCEWTNVVNEYSHRLTVDGGCCEKCTLRGLKRQHLC
jgi:hypothetical protein